MCIYLIASFCFILLELLVVEGFDLLNSSELRPLYSQLGRSLIGCLIWVPYMLVSERVKHTFTLMLQPKTPTFSTYYDQREERDNSAAPTDELEVKLKEE